MVFQLKIRPDHRNCEKRRLIFQAASSLENSFHLFARNLALLQIPFMLQIHKPAFEPPCAGFVPVLFFPDKNDSPIGWWRAKVRGGLLHGLAEIVI